MFTMSWLSRNEARFGNKIFAYFFLVYLHRQTGIKCTAAEWLGNQLFQLPLPIASKPLEKYLCVNLEPLTNRNSTPLHNVHLLSGLIAQTGLPIDIGGSFQYSTNNLKAEDKELFLSTFQLNKRLKSLLDNVLSELNGDRGHFIAIHYRAGDYLSFDKHPLFWTPPFQTIIELTKLLAARFPSAKLFLASDSLSHKNKFREAFPDKTFCSVSASGRFGNDLILDFLMLTQANLVVAANSSFSISACLMNTKAGNFLRPLNRNGDYVIFDPWNTPVLIPC
jgi:hypothetical protein